MDPKDRRLAALFAAGLFFFYSPILTPFNRPVSVGGLPLLPLYVFAAWCGLVTLAWALSRSKRR